MEREIAIEVKNLYISYRNLQKFSIKQSLLHFKKVQADVFQAVKDVSFEVEKGEILGIIGKNGSLLKEAKKDATRELKKILGAPVDLDLWVKVSKDWKNKDYILRELGYKEHK